MVVVGAVLALLLGACGSGGNSSSTASGTTPKTTPQTAGAALLRPADPSAADRTITITATQNLTFDPASVTVRSGETVTFKVVNSSSLVHEFDVGDAAYQAQHEQEMQAMPAGMVMNDEPTAIVVNPGQTKSLTLDFLQPGNLVYGCHQTGHYAAGMKGTITVT
jgi:uncharacterized cupredoxin-like copper-binding protein